MTEARSFFTQVFVGSIGFLPTVVFQAGHTGPGWSSALLVLVGRPKISEI
jgi:hypothetical protein